VKAPTAATRMVSARFGWPLDIDSAARAMTKDSLGMGGKNPSIVANKYIPRYTRGRGHKCEDPVLHLSPAPGSMAVDNARPGPGRSRCIADRVRDH